MGKSAKAEMSLLPVCDPISACELRCKASKFAAAATNQNEVAMSRLIGRGHGELRRFTAHSLKVKKVFMFN